jgi:hypothetical protein
VLAERVEVSDKVADIGCLFCASAVGLPLRASVVVPKRVTRQVAVALAVITGPADTMALRSEVTLAVAVTVRVASSNRIGPPVATGVAKALTPVR